MKATVTKQQIIAIQTLLAKNNFKAERKESLVAGFTNQRTVSVAQLFYSEAEELKKFLQAIANGETLQEQQAAEKMRKKIISLAHEMHWHKEGTVKIDIKAIDSWCKKYSYLHKELNQYTYKELPKLVSQFEQGPYKDYISKL